MNNIQTIQKKKVVIQFAISDEEYTAIQQVKLRGENPRKPNKEFYKELLLRGADL
jgi:hypothetical protein